jgi:FlgD Ig-like domain
MSGRLGALAAVLLLAAASPALAGGPLLIYDPATGAPYAYPPGTVTVYTDLGSNGFLTNAESDTLVAHTVQTWSAVPTSYFSAAIAGEILVDGVPTDITAANVDSIISTDGHEADNGGGIYVIYDTDGTIFSDFFGAPPGAAGVASPEFSQDGTPNLTESWVAINGSVINPGDTSPYPGATMEGVYVHEFGHAINLAHTQTNGSIVFFGDNDGPSGCPSMGGIPDLSQIETMYPFIDNTPGSTGLYAATVDQIDDVAALSDIYPAAGWPASTGTITGTIFMPDGSTQVSGVNVIARNLADPLGDCNSAISGDHTQGVLGADGRFTLHGLTPGAQYAVYVDKLVDGAGFSTTPTSVFFLEEYWNGAGESGDGSADTSCVYVPITAAAGSSATADILLNVAQGALSLGDDDAVQVSLPFGFSFCGSVYQTVWVNSNGNLTFGNGDTNPSASATSLLVGAPRICGLWDDLDPGSGGVVTAAEEGGNFVVRYLQVPDVFAVYFGGGPSTFTITLRPDGTSRVDYGTTETYLSTVAGRSPGGGAADPGATDLTAAAQPLGQGTDTVYEEFFLGDDLSGASLEYAPCGAQVGVPDQGTLPAAALLQSRPNPFRAATTISFDLPGPGPVTLRVYDVRGRLVATLADRTLDAGRHAFPWGGKDDAGRDVAPGTYFYRLETPTFRATRKTIRAW